MLQVKDYISNLPNKECSVEGTLPFLPFKIILHIASFIKRDYLSQDTIDDIEDDLVGNGINMQLESIKQLLKENKGDGEYYPLRNLYATCFSFNWLSELEYICIESGEFYNNIASRNINGLAHGMSYNINTGISGYSIYNNGEIIRENILYTDTAYHYREIDGIVYYEYENCVKWNQICRSDCKNCLQLNKIQKDIFDKDHGIEKIINAEYDNGTVIIRTPLYFEPFLNLDYDSEGLIPKLI